VRPRHQDTPREGEATTLSLISIGIRDERDMSLRAIEEARGCDALYAELYTMEMETEPQRLSKTIGKPVEPIGRGGLEEGSEAILGEAEGRRVGVLVGGDCLTATTHVSLLLEARRRGIPTRVVHGSSILTAVAETGLSLYKFGRTVTLPLPEKGPADTVLTTLEGNLELGLHTLILLDLDTEEGRFVTVPRAILRLLEADRPETFGPGTLVVGVARLGWSEPVIKAGKASEIAGIDFGGPPHALMVPGSLHFLEEEALRVIAGCPEEAMRGRVAGGELDRLTEKYSRACRMVLDGMEMGRLPREIGESRVRELLDHAERYLSDAVYYAGDRKATALASVSYAEGVLDALKLLGLVDFEW